ncbi:MAG: FAD:protein FMN transferase [Candidatus Woesearchaeota archaeon]|jgi:thiamine biosynthesis lipoprotein ApbE|nr:FAD:protein FMN transferase [Candidatus Woesearchaeota archaeon]
MIITKKLMGGNVSIEINNSENDKKVIEYGFFEMQKLINKFNFFDDESMLSKLNLNKDIENDSEFKFILEKGMEFYSKTNGLFNIFLGKDIRDRKTNSKVKEGLNLDIDSIIIFENGKIKLNSDIELDLGGFVKGYIIDVILNLIKKKYDKSNIYIDARGDIVLDSSKKIRIYINNPFENKIIEQEYVDMKRGSIITSGHDKQKYKFGSHILGNKSDIYTITLISEKDKCYELDALGTYFIQLNSEDVLKKIEFDEKYKNIEILIILENGKILKSSFFDMYK